MISRSKTARSFSHIRLNVVGLFQKRSPRPINRHSLLVNTVCCCCVGMCRRSTVLQNDNFLRVATFFALSMTPIEPANRGLTSN